MLRLVGLDEHLAGDAAPSGPPRHLGHELKGALPGVVLGEKEPLVSSNNPHQGDAGEVMALGDHLGAHQDVHLAGAKITQNLESLAAVRRRVPVQAGHPGSGPQTPHFALHPLGPHPVLFDGGGLARGAALGHGHLEATVMADEDIPGVVLG